MTQRAIPLAATFLLLLAAVPATLLTPAVEAGPYDDLPPGCVRPGGVDVFFLVDLTGSMGGVLTAVQTQATAIMDDLAANFSDIRFGAASHMDYPGYFEYPGYATTYGYSGDYPWRLDSDFTTDKTLVQAAVNSMVLGSGADGPESYTRALYEVNEVVSWGETRQKVLVFFGDNFPHDTNWAGYNHGGDPGRDATAQTADDLDFETVTAALAARGVQIVGVDNGGFSPMMGYLATATGGRSYLMSDTSRLRQDIVTLIQGELRTDTEAPTGAFLSPSPASPQVYDGATSLGPSPYPENAVVDGDLPITVTAADNCRVETVTLTSLNGAVTYGTDTTAPYEFVFPTAGKDAGIYFLTATVTDWVGRTATSILPVRILRATEAGVALGSFSGLTHPATAEVRLGGAAATGPADIQHNTYDHQLVPGILQARTFFDQAGAFRYEDGTSWTYGRSHVSTVCLLDCLVQAQEVHASAIVEHTLAGLGGTIDTSESKIVGLTINGVPVPVTAPNTEIPIPGVGFLRVLEILETTSPVGVIAQVNGLHLLLDTPTTRGEIIVGSAKASAGYLSPDAVGLDRAVAKPDDAGLGADAPESIEAAAPLAPGAYGARFEARGFWIEDRDAFVLDVPENTRIVIDAAMAQRAVVRAQASPASAPFAQPGEMETQVLPDGYISLYDSEGALRSQLNLLLGRHLEFNTDKPGPWYALFHASVDVAVNYTFTYQAVPVVFVPDIEGGVQGDAPGECGEGRGILPGLHAGSLRRGDETDAYRFPVTRGETIALLLKPDESVDGANFDLELYDPECSLLDISNLGEDGLKALPDAIAHLAAERTGEYTVRIVRIDGSGNYHLTLHHAENVPTVPGNDALSGRDSTSEADAIPVGNPGAYEGTFHDGDDVDWYAFVANPATQTRILVVPGTGSVLRGSVEGPFGTIASTQAGTPFLLTVAAGWSGTLHLKLEALGGGGNYLFAIAGEPR